MKILKYIVSLIATTVVFSLSTCLYIVFMSEADGRDPGTPILLLAALVMTCLLIIPPAHVFILLLERIVKRKLSTLFAFALSLLCLVPMFLPDHITRKPVLSSISEIAYYVTPVFLFIAMLRLKITTTGKQTEEDSVRVTNREKENQYHD